MESEDGCRDQTWKSRDAGQPAKLTIGIGTIAAREDSGKSSAPKETIRKMNDER